MGAEIFSFPPARRDGARRRQYRFAQVARMLFLDDLEPRAQVDRLRKLHDQRGLPLPQNPRVWQGRVQSGAAAIGARSTWCAMEFDAWLDSWRNPTPPPAAAAVPPAPPTVRADCAARARQLAGAA
jgi:hypothetical protein